MQNPRTKEVRWVWIRIAVMCASLAGVVYTIWNFSDLRDRRPELNFCPTRVGAIELKGKQKLKIYQDGSTWVGTKDNADTNPVASLGVEKWLGQYCFVRAEKILESKHVPNSATEVLELSYIDGRSDQILSLDGELFYWQGGLYRTKEWESLLSEFKNLLP